MPGIACSCGLRNDFSFPPFCIQLNLKKDRNFYTICICSTLIFAARQSEIASYFNFSGFCKAANKGD
jgi:hypothetical protein